MSADLQFFQLPVVPDEGLPQVFTCPVGAGSYDFALYANLTVPDDDPPETMYDLSTYDPSTFKAPAEPLSPVGYLVLRVTAPSPAGPQVILLRKLVPEPGLIHYGGALAVKVVQAKVARGNLNGFGHYGSQITIGVAQRWA
ncbi:hypothetical protein [Mycobacterium sp.]|uniref:hypothetical protein n=1 Tax=Mycobacterium sp. TaxID=1785 RepID=UPI003D14954C